MKVDGLERIHTGLPLGKSGVWRNKSENGVGVQDLYTHREAAGPAINVEMSIFGSANRTLLPFFLCVGGGIE